MQLVFCFDIILGIITLFVAAIVGVFEGISSLILFFATRDLDGVTF